ncbi:MAG: aspartate-semialdehyde dehydrogenase [Bdellovibrionaceae bacterium]|nr:aspartate-semialdehyde dehydrogenase [Bdellovibrionales bacterium]MCB9086370.1 aspartate-semialdehyde dehydrogenase [Pseudobdellovibrionaceae bacterium]
MVGEEFLSLIEQRRFPLKELKPFASDDSKGKKVICNGQEWTCTTLEPGCFKGLDLVFFSSGDDISKEWAPKAVEDGAFAIDNSAAFRMDPNTALVVPEINGDLLPKPGLPKVIANPNCSTIQLVLALAPLKESFGISQVHVASYQAVSGAGKAGKEELLNQTRCVVSGEPAPAPSAFPHTIAYNCIPQIGGFNDQGFCSEEMKIMKETNKILRDADIKVSAFTVRVPTLNGHAEAAWVTLKKQASREEVVKSLQSLTAIEVWDNPTDSHYPTAAKCSGTDPVYVGRLHQDLHDPLTWIMWIVADNLRVGAALNGIRIAEKIYKL